MFAMAFSSSQCRYWQPRTRGLRYYLIDTMRTSYSDTPYHIANRHGWYLYRSDLDALLSIAAKYIVIMESERCPANATETCILNYIDYKRKVLSDISRFIELYKRCR